MLKSVSKLKIKATVGNMRIFPFDVLYVFNKKDEDLIRRVFSTALVFSPGTELMKKAEGLPIDVKEFIGSKRHLRKSTGFSPAITLDSAFRKLSQDNLFVVPVKTKRVGDKVLPSYMVNRNVQEILEKKYTEVKLYGWNNRYSRGYGDTEKLFSSIYLSTEASGESSPCTVCCRGLKKVTAPDSCFLGTSDCMNNLIFPKTVTLQDPEEEAKEA